MEKTSAVSVSQTVVASTWQGPIPDPASLAAYGKLVPDAPERILRMAEEEARTRRELMAKDHEAENVAKAVDVQCYHDGVRRGQWLAFSILAVCIAGSVVCAICGATSVGVAIAGVGFANIVSQFIGRKNESH